LTDNGKHIRGAGSLIRIYTKRGCELRQEIKQAQAAGASQTELNALSTELEKHQSKFWYLSYYHNGRQIRESSKTDSRMVAAKMLTKRLGEIATGKQPAADVAKIRYEHLRDRLYLDYRNKKRKSMWTDRKGNTYLPNVKPLDAFFAGYRANAITTDAVHKFVSHLQDKGKANGTINRSLTALKRMFKLQMKDGKLYTMPNIEMLKEADARDGFVTIDEFHTLRDALPNYLKGIVTVGYFTGMRLGEIRKLRWDMLDLDGKRPHIRLSGAKTKNGKPRTAPLNTETVLVLSLLKRTGAYVFCGEAGGKTRLGDFRKAWRSACVRAGLGRMICPSCKTTLTDHKCSQCDEVRTYDEQEYEGLIFHDLRRSAVRDLVRAGVPEKTAMGISGHKTRSVFDRYNIVSDDDLVDAIERRDAYHAAQRAEHAIQRPAQQRDVDGAASRTSKEQVN